MWAATSATQRAPLDIDHALLVSDVWYGRNRIGSARKSIAAPQVQSYANFGSVVEEGDSTDGTLAAFQSATAPNPRIKVFSGNANGNVGDRVRFFAQPMVAAIAGTASGGRSISRRVNVS